MPFGLFVLEMRNHRKLNDSKNAVFSMYISVMDGTTTLSNKYHPDNNSPSSHTHCCLE